MTIVTTSGLIQLHKYLLSSKGYKAYCAYNLYHVIGQYTSACIHHIEADRQTTLHFTDIIHHVCRIAGKSQMNSHLFGIIFTRKHSVWTGTIYYPWCGTEFIAQSFDLLDTLSVQRNTRKYQHLFRHACHNVQIPVCILRMISFQFCIYC